MAFVEPLHERLRALELSPNAGRICPGGRTLTSVSFGTSFSASSTILRISAGALIAATYAQRQRPRLPATRSLTGSVCPATCTRSLAADERHEACAHTHAPIRHGRVTLRRSSSAPSGGHICAGLGSEWHRRAVEVVADSLGGCDARERPGVPAATVPVIDVAGVSPVPVQIWLG